MACAGAVCVNVGVAVIAGPLECLCLFDLIFLCALASKCGFERAHRLR